MKKIIIFLFLAYSLVSLFASQVAQAQESAYKETYFVPQVTIDDTFKQGEQILVGEYNPDTKKTTITVLSQYIQSIYNYAIGAIGVLATVVLMYGGVLWIIAAGNAERVGEAKAWIGAALSGLVLALASYSILFMVNPRLISNSAIPIDVVTLLSEGEKDVQGQSVSLGDLKTNLQSLGIPCNEQSCDLQTLTDATVGKVTYSQGSKGNKPELDKGYERRELDSDKQHIYLDCSSYVQSLWMCCGYGNPGNTTTGIFKEGNILTTEKLASLKDGCIVGYTEKSSANGFGHAYIYGGDGIFYNSSSNGNKGRKPGQGVNLKSIETIKNLLETLNKKGGNFFYKCP
ncbi:MAG: pilin [bacterium]